MAFRSVVLNAMDSWEELLRSRTRQLDPAVDPENDDFRRDLLETLRIHYCVSFTGWRAEEVAVFTLLAFPRKELARLTRKGKVSRFIDHLHEKWRPTFFDWMHFLWRFSGRAHEFFCDLLFLLPANQKAPAAEMGRVLFRDMIETGLMRPRTASSVIGALVPWPLESTMAIAHEKKISELSKELTAVETGAICRNLLLYRCRKKCVCGYQRGEVACFCGKRYMKTNHYGARGEDLQFDLDKEYASALFRLVLQRRQPRGVVLDLQWDERQGAEFIRSGCEFVFSEPVYIEIFQNLNSGRRPDLKQENPRELSDMERSMNSLRVADGDYDQSIAKHSGCVTPGCKQFFKQECANVSCKQHCVYNGVNECKVHRHYIPNKVLSYRPRKNIVTDEDG